MKHRRPVTDKRQSNTHKPKQDKHPKERSISKGRKNFSDFMSRMYSQSKKKGGKARLKGIQSTSVLAIPKNPLSRHVAEGGTKGIKTERAHNRKSNKHTKMQNKHKQSKQDTKSKKIESITRGQSMHQKKTQTKRKRNQKETRRKEISEDFSRNVVKKKFVGRSKSKSKSRNFQMRKFNVNVNIKNRLKIFEEKEPSVEDHMSIDGDFERSPVKLPKIQENSKFYVSPNDIMKSLEIQKLDNNKPKQRKQQKRQGGNVRRKKDVVNSAKHMVDYSRELADLAPEKLTLDELMSSKRRKKKKNKQSQLNINKSVEFTDIPIRKYLTNSKDIFSTLGPRNTNPLRSSAVNFQASTLTGSQVIQPTQRGVFHKIRKIDMRKSINPDSKARNGRSQSRHFPSKSKSRAKVQVRSDLNMGGKLRKKKGIISSEQIILKEDSPKKIVRFQNGGSKGNVSLSARRNHKHKNSSKRVFPRSNTKDAGRKKADRSRNKFRSNKATSGGKRPVPGYQSESASGKNSKYNSKRVDTRKKDQKQIRKGTGSRQKMGKKKGNLDKGSDLNGNDKDRFEQMKNEFQKKFLNTSKKNKSYNTKFKHKNSEKELKSKPSLNKHNFSESKSKSDNSKVSNSMSSVNKSKQGSLNSSKVQGMRVISQEIDDYSDHVDFSSNELTKIIEKSYISANSKDGTQELGNTVEVKKPVLINIDFGAVNAPRGNEDESSQEKEKEKKKSRSVSAKKDDSRLEKIKRIRERIREEKEKVQKEKARSRGVSIEVKKVPELRQSKTEMKSKITKKNDKIIKDKINIEESNKAIDSEGVKSIDKNENNLNESGLIANSILNKVFANNLIFSNDTKKEKKKETEPKSETRESTDTQNKKSIEGLHKIKKREEKSMDFKLDNINQKINGVYVGKYSPQNSKVYRNKPSEKAPKEIKKNKKILSPKKNKKINENNKKLKEKQDDLKQKMKDLLLPTPKTIVSKKAKLKKQNIRDKQRRHEESKSKDLSREKIIDRVKNRLNKRSPYQRSRTRPQLPKTPSNKSFNNSQESSKSPSKPLKPLIKLEQVGRLSSNFGIKVPKSNTQKTLISNLEKIKKLKPLDNQRFGKNNPTSSKKDSGTPDLLPSPQVSSKVKVDLKKVISSKNRFDETLSDKDIKQFHFEKSYKEFMEVEEKVKKIGTEPELDSQKQKKLNFDFPHSSLVKNTFAKSQNQNLSKSKKDKKSGNKMKNIQIPEAHLDSSNNLEQSKDQDADTHKSSLNNSQMNEDQKMALGFLEPTLSTTMKKKLQLQKIDNLRASRKDSNNGEGHSSKDTKVTSFRKNVKDKKDMHYLTVSSQRIAKETETSSKANQSMNKSNTFRSSMSKKSKKSKKKKKKPQNPEFFKLKKEWEKQKKTLSSSIELFNLVSSNRNINSKKESEIEIFVGKRLTEPRNLSVQNSEKEVSNQVGKVKTKSKFSLSKNSIPSKKSQKKSIRKSAKKSVQDFKHQMKSKTNTSFSNMGDPQMVSDSSFEWLVENQRRKSREFDNVRNNSAKNRDFERRLKKSFSRNKKSFLEENRKGIRKSPQRFSEFDGINYSMNQDLVKNKEKTQRKVNTVVAFDLLLENKLINEDEVKK